MSTYTFLLKKKRLSVGIPLLTVHTGVKLKYKLPVAHINHWALRHLVAECWKYGADNSLRVREGDNEKRELARDHF